MSSEPRMVLITGAAGHLGRAVAARFAQAGDRLLLVDRQAEALEAAFGSGGAHQLVAVDLLDSAGSLSALGAALQRAGRVEVVCHLAGGFRMGEAVHETTDHGWALMVDLNARSLVNVARAVVPHLIAQGGGKIVTVGAFAAQKGQARMGAYCASKSALIRLTEAMSAELKEHGINVNCVLPTLIDTADNRAAMPEDDPARWVSPQALAEVIAFLGSEAARAVHGAALPVTGLS